MSAQLELQNIKSTLPLGPSEETTGGIVDLTQHENARRIGFRPREVLLEEDRNEIFNEAVDLRRLKKYYKKMKRSLRWGRLLALFLVWTMLWFCCAEIPNVWGVQGNKHKISLQALGKLSSAGLWAQVPTTVALVFIFFWFVWNLWRLACKRAQIDYELDLCNAKYYPTQLSVAFKDRVKTYFSYRINLFWIGVFFFLLGIIGIVYGNAGLGWKAISNSSFNEKWWMLNFDKSSWGYCTALGGLLSVFLGVAILLVFNLLFRYKIKKILSIFGLNEYNMPAEIRDRAFRINRRDKTICLVLLSIFGLVLYIIFKRVIVAIYRMSFKRSRY